MRYLVVVITLLCLIGVGCKSSGGGGDAVEDREFYITDYSIEHIWYACWYPMDSGSGSEGETFQQADPEVESGDLPEYSDSRYLLRVGGSYMLFVDHINDKDNTAWLAYEIFVNGKRYRGAGIADSIYKSRDQLWAIVLFQHVPWDLRGKTVSVDVWFEDEDGVASEIYTFDLTITDWWDYINDPAPTE